MKPAILLLAAFVAYAQAGREPAKYDAASIKPNAEAETRVAFQIRADGTLAANAVTLKRLLMTAYNVQGFRIVGGPSWVASSRWNLQAKPNRATSPDEVRQMLRALLEDRFQLHSHSETRTLPIYELTVDGKGSKLPRAQDAAVPVVRVNTGSIQLKKATSATFASQLSYALGRTIADKTNLSGEFDFALEWTPEPGEDDGPTTAGFTSATPPPPPATADGPSIFTAILEQLGLRLKAARGPVDVIVIDSVQMPAAD